MMFRQVDIQDDGLKLDTNLVGSSSPVLLLSSLLPLPPVEGKRKIGAFVSTDKIDQGNGIG